jgi:hypothetical protein
MTTSLGTPSQEPAAAPIVPNSIVALAAGRLVASCVTQQDTATLVTSVALWSLREMGAVDFSLWEYERWWWPWQPGSALMIGIERVKDLGPSLEQELLNGVSALAARPHKGPDLRVRVRDVIREWFGRDYGNPHSELILRAGQQATTAGWYEVAVPPRKNRLARYFLGPGVVYAPSLGGAAAIERRTQTLTDDWQRFRRDENDLSSRLIETVRWAIPSRTIQSD